MGQERDNRYRAGLDGIGSTQNDLRMKSDLSPILSLSSGSIGFTQGGKSIRRKRRRQQYWY